MTYWFAAQRFGSGEAARLAGPSNSIIAQNAFGRRGIALGGHASRADHAAHGGADPQPAAPHSLDPGSEGHGAGRGNGGFTVKLSMFIG